MDNNLLKVSSILIAVLIFMPLGLLAIGSSASPVYENDQEEHFIMPHSLPGGSIDGIVGNEWPASSLVGNLWCTSEIEPVGKIYMVHDDGILYIGVRATYPGSLMADDGHWIRIDWDRDTSMEVVDNMGNSGVEFACGDIGFEYAIPISNELIVNDRFNLLLHGEMLGLPSAPEGETTTFPFREPGSFFSTTMVLEYAAPNTPPVAAISYYPYELKVYLDGTNSYDSDGWIISYFWNFGDGQESCGDSMIHKYNQPGEYTITLTVEDNGGSSGYDTKTIEICVPEPVPEPEPTPEPEPIPDPEFTGSPNLSYTIEYAHYADRTIVNESGIFFYVAAYPELYKPVYFNDTYSLPAEDYGTYKLYNSWTPVYIILRITNHDDVAHNGIQVTTIQEFHNTVTLWDDYGEFTVEKGQPLGGDSVSNNILDIGPNQEEFIVVQYMFEGRGYGLDQTHVIISHGGITLFDDSEAGVYCPP